MIGANRNRFYWNNVEYLFGLTTLICLIYTMWYLGRYGYLPQPYFYDPADVWGDWFNTVEYAHTKSFYDVWGSIYPPISVVFMRIFSLRRCIGSDELRTCDWLALATLHGFFILNIVLIAWSYLKLDRATALPRSFALAGGLPMTFALDRGNLVIVTMTCVIFAYGPLTKSARLKWLAAGMAVNFKIYMIAPIFAQLGRRRWRWFEGAILSTILVYAVTYAIVGDGNPVQLYKNVLEFTGVYQAINILDLWYSGTYGPALSLLNGFGFPIVNAIGSDTVDRLNFLLPLLLHIAQASIILAFGLTWLRPGNIPMHRLTCLALAFALITTEAGGYTQVFMLYLAFMEKPDRAATRFALIIAYILCIPFDIPFSQGTPLPVVRDSYWLGRSVVVEYKLAWGPFLRPLLIMLIPFSLAIATIGDIVRAWWAERGAPLTKGSGIALPEPS